MPDTEIEFLLIGELSEIFFNPGRPEGLDFGPTEEAVSISLRPVDSEDHGLGPVACRATVAVGASAEEVAFVEALLDRRYLRIAGAPVVLPHVVRGATRIDAQGNISEGAPVRFEELPPTVQGLCVNARALLTASVDRFLKLARWQQEIDAPPNMMPNQGLYWRTAPGHYHGVPLPKQYGEGRSPAGLQWSEPDQHKMAELWRSKAEEPLGHELLREAASLMSSVTLPPEAPSV